MQLLFCLLNHVIFPCIIYNVHDPLISMTFTELLLQAVPSQRRCCCWRELMCILLWIIIASAIPATVVLNFKHQTHNVSYLGYGGDSIELLTVDGFWYEDLIVSQVVEASDQEHKIQLYLPLCSELDIHEKSGHFLSPYHCHSYPTRYLGVREFLHLLTGSKVTYSFCMRSNETQDVTEAEFYVFDDHSKYLDFVNGAGSGRKTSIHRYRMRVGTASEPIACTQFTFTAKKSSYYFMTGSSKAGVTYQYSVTTRIKYLDFKDYHENKSCSALTAKNPCEISVGEQFLSKSEKYCLLAHIIPHHNKHQQLSRTTHVRVYTVKRGEVVAIPIMVVVVGVAGLLVVMMTYCCCCCKKCCKRRSQGRGYTLINV